MATTPWYTTPAALAVIHVIQASPPEQVRCADTDREVYAYRGETVDALYGSWLDAYESDPDDFDVIRAHPQDVIAAALGEHLVGQHFASDLLRLRAMAGEIAGASMREAA